MSKSDQGKIKQVVVY